MLPMILNSIENEVPSENRQIIIVGGSSIDFSNILHIPFDETTKNKWITRKKNIITEYSEYENIVYMHDYIKLQPKWYQGQLKMGNEFDIRMDCILNFDDTRFRDWTLWPDLPEKLTTIVQRQCIMPYDVNYMSRYMYISGAYWIAKRRIMQEFPLDEKLVWGEAEDVDWSLRVREFYKFQMNQFSTVKICKYGKDKVFEYMTDYTKHLIELYFEENG
jgi:hypothetical protein